MEDKHVIHTEPGTFTTYLSGFILSLVLTLAAYFIITEHFLEGAIAIFTIIALALAQAAVQLYFFLHLGEESKPRWNMVTFLFMLTVLIVIVLGSLWIMANLNYRMMSM